MAHVEERFTVSSKPFLSVYRSCCDNYGVPYHSSIVDQGECQGNAIFNLMDSKLAGPGLHAALLALASSQSIQQIILDNLQFDSTAKTLLLEALCENSNIVQLSLAGCNIDESFGELLIEAVMESDSPFRVLNLRNNKLTGTNAILIARALESRLCYLEQLDLSGNSLRDGGVLAILETLECDHRLVSLGISRTGIGAKSARGIITLLNCNSAISTIDIQYNKIGKCTEDRIQSILNMRNSSTANTVGDVSVALPQHNNDIDSQSDTNESKGSTRSYSSPPPKVPEFASNDSTKDQLNKVRAEWTMSISTDPLEAWSTTPQAVIGTRGTEVSAPLVEDVDKVLYRCVNKLQDYMVNSADEENLLLSPSGVKSPAHQPFHSVVQSLLWCADAATLQNELLATTKETNHSITERIKELTLIHEQQTTMLANQARSVSALTRRNAVLEASASRVEKVQQNSQSEISKLKEQLEILEREHESCKTRLSARKKASASNCKVSGSKCMVAHQEWREVELAKFETHNQQLRDQLTKALKRNVDLEHRLAVKMGRAQQRAKQQRQHAAENNLREKLDIEKSKVKLANERVGKLQAQLTQVLLQMRDSGGTLKEARQKSEKALRDLDQANGRVFSMETRMTKMSVQLHQLEYEMKLAREQEKSWKSEIESVTHDAAATRTDNLSLIERNKELSRQLGEAQREVTELRIEQNHESLQHTELQECVQDLQTRNEELSGTLAIKDDELNKLHGEISEFEINVEQLKGELASKVATIDELCETNSKLELNLKELTVKFSQNLNPAPPCLVTNTSQQFTATNNTVLLETKESPNKAADKILSETNDHSQPADFEHIRTEYRTDHNPTEYGELESPLALAAADLAQNAHERIHRLTQLLQHKEEEISRMQIRIASLEELVENDLPPDEARDELEKRVQQLERELRVAKEEFDELLQMMVEREATQS